MKPFDLEAAKRGEPICYANGKPAKFECVTSGGWIITSDAGGNVWIHQQSGNTLHAPSRHLHMAPRKREGWVAISPVKCNSRMALCTHPYTTAAEAVNQAEWLGWKNLTTVRIEWPE